MALNLLVVFERKQVDERLQETGLDNGRLGLGVNRDIADAGGSREDEREISGLEQAEERGQAVGFDNLKLVLLWVGDTKLDHQGSEREFYAPSLARFRSAKAAWH